MVDGKIAFAAGSTVPTLEAPSVVIPPAQKEVKAEDDGEIDTNLTLLKTEPGLSPSPASRLEVKFSKADTMPAILPGSLLVGDLRLAILKARLASLSIPAEFAGEGVLVCGPGIHQGSDAKGGSIVSVRKLEEGHIILEGGIGKVYYDVRKELYGGFARVVTA